MNCKNCEIELAEANGYCHKCGARIIKNRLTFKNLLQQAGEEFFNYDNKLLKTIKHLFTKPEAVINGYIKGTRKKYVNPISLVTISLAISGIQMYLIKNFFPDFFTAPAISSIPDNEQNKEIAKLTQEMMVKMADSVEITTFITIPLLALMSYFIFKNLKKYNYIEHLIIYLYTYSITSIVGSLLTIFAFLFKSSTTAALLGFLSLPFMLIYNIYVLKRTMAIDWGRMILKTFFFFILGIFSYIMLIIMSGLIMIIYIKLGGELPEFIQAFIDAGKAAGEAAKAKQGS